jgi:hypothetical protein
MTRKIKLKRKTNLSLDEKIQRLINSNVRGYTTEVIRLGRKTKVRFKWKWVQSSEMVFGKDGNIQWNVKRNHNLQESLILGKNIIPWRTYVKTFT